MRIGIAFRLGVLLAAVGFLASGLTGFYAYNVSRDLLIQRARKELLISTQGLARRISLNRQEASRNLQVLATHPAAVHLLQTHSAESEDQIAVIFTQVLKANPNYFQIRLISASDFGLERVRIDRDGNKALRIQGDDLQEKGHYAYVSDTLAMPSGKTYLSRIVINHEDGAHAGQDQPTVILATPVTNATGQALGLVVINLDLNGLFGLLKADLPTNFELFLANSQGDYLVHPDVSKTFGFDRGRSFLVQEEFPETKPLVDGLLESITLYAKSKDQSDTPLLATFIRSDVRIPNNENRLVLGLAQPLQIVLDQSKQLGWAILQIVVAFFLGSTVLAIFLAKAITRPINAMSQAVQAFADDHRVLPLPLSRKDEIGALAQSVEKMQRQINHQLAELKASHAQLEHLASHDVLTGLPNRRLFQDRLEHTLAGAKRSGERFSLVFIDVDEFKNINDRWGHESGDAVLQFTAQRLATLTRKADTVARMGGDEFVILMNTQTHRSQMINIAEKLLEGLRAPMEIAGQEILVGFSMGISRYPEDGETATELMASADQAMYEIKAAGRNGYRFFSPSTTGPGDY